MRFIVPFVLCLILPATGAWGATFTVSSTADPGDGTCDASCTLRDAILAANANGSAETDLIGFDLAGTAPYTIQPASDLPAVTTPVAIDGTTEPDFVAAPIIVLDGQGARNLGIELDGSGSSVRGLVVQRFVTAGIQLDGTGGHRVAGSFVGTDPTGTLARGNGVGILIASSTNVVGGVELEDRNLVSANAYGVVIYGAANVVANNYIGTDATGTADLGNAFDGVALVGVLAQDNLIGGVDNQERNLISGNDENGVLIAGGAAYNVVQNSLIGTNASGTAAVANLRGVFIDGSAGNVIGGDEVTNIISGNSLAGVLIYGSGSTDNVLRANYIGLAASGVAAIPNRVGVEMGGSANVVGGRADQGEGNWISGNTTYGVYIVGADSQANRVSGNFIGTTRDGLAALGNGYGGVGVASDFHIIGGDVALTEGNLIAGNALGGVDLTGHANTVAGNVIGLAANGTTALGNGAGAGVSVRGSEHDVAANEIAANAVGVYVTGVDTLAPLIEGNDVHGNAAEGILVALGDEVGIVGNRIADNGADGVAILSGTFHRLFDNSIYDNAGLGIDLGDDGVTANDAKDADTGPNDYQNFPVVTTASASSTHVEGTFASKPQTEYTLQFFGNAACDGTHGEGEVYLGQVVLTTNGSGTATFNTAFSETAPVGGAVTATATGPTGTSEFSACTPVVAATDHGIAIRAFQVRNGAAGATVPVTIFIKNTGAHAENAVSIAILGGTGAGYSASCQGNAASYSTDGDLDPGEVIAVPGCTFTYGAAGTYEHTLEVTHPGLAPVSETVTSAAR